eukprot:1158387-Pelagomonas_calceolata.AAC.1
MAVLLSPPQELCVADVKQLYEELEGNELQQVGQKNMARACMAQSVKVDTGRRTSKLTNALADLLGHLLAIMRLQGCNLQLGGVYCNHPACWSLPQRYFQSFNAATFVPLGKGNEGQAWAQKRVPGHLESC